MEDTQKKESFYSKIQSNVKEKMVGVEESKRKLYFVIIAVCGFALLFLSLVPNTCSRKTEGRPQSEQVTSESDLPTDSVVDELRFTN